MDTSRASLKYLRSINFWIIYEEIQKDQNGILEYVKNNILLDQSVLNSLSPENSIFHTERGWPEQTFSIGSRKGGVGSWREIYIILGG